MPAFLPAFLPRAIALCLLAPTLLPTLLPAQRPSAPAARVDRRDSTLARGLTWTRLRDPRGPWTLHVVRVDLSRTALSLEAVHARDALTGRERPSVIAARMNDSTSRVRVAINADFFDLATGRSENSQVTAGEWWKGLMLTESPFDTYDNVHAQFALSRSGVGAVERFVPDGHAWVRGRHVPLLSVNALPTGRHEGTALYTPRFGATAAVDTVHGAVRDSLRRVSELPVRRVGTRGDTVLYVASAAAAARSGQAIGPEGAVLAAYGDRATAWQDVAAGDTVRVWIGTLPRQRDARPPALLLGGWPRVLQGGDNIAADAAIREGTISRNAEARHPRSAVGVSRDGRTLWLVAVDGRSATSVGMTLVELADALRALGAWDALNFDGGGSTTLVIDGAVVNAPTDPSGEREVANVLLVRERRGGR
ncbi:MAG: phosphodiester glycosidase family protein [Gemmatimonadetes bacterium]|nr:phosphodiester glycosidase family protein [Gemmatimonadota bacterium]